MIVYQTHEEDWGYDGIDEYPIFYYFTNNPRFVWVYKGDRL